MEDRLRARRAVGGLAQVFWGFLIAAFGSAVIEGLPIAGVVGGCLVIAGLTRLPRSGIVNAAEALTALQVAMLLRLWLLDFEFGSSESDPASLRRGYLEVAAWLAVEVASTVALLLAVARGMRDAGVPGIAPRVESTGRTFGIAAGSVFVLWLLVLFMSPWGVEGFLVLLAGALVLWCAYLAVALRLWDAFRAFERVVKGRSNRRRV